MREDYSPPDEEELERRISNLKTRFPDVPRDGLLTELNARHGHAGYAAAALLRIVDKALLDFLHGTL